MNIPGDGDFLAGASKALAARGPLGALHLAPLGDVERLADRFAILIEGRLSASMHAQELKDHLAERGVMRLRLTALPPGLLERVRRLSPKSLWAADELIVPGPASLRPAVLDLVREAGGEIRGLTAEEERLDTFYRELVAERP